MLNMDRGVHDRFKMKALTAKLLIVALFASLFMIPVSYDASAKSQKPIQLMIDGKSRTSSVSPMMINNSVFVPLRQVASTWNSRVDWNSRTRQITIRKDNNTFVLNVNSRSATRNKRPLTLNAAPVIVRNTTMVPVRFIAESFGAQVNWNPRQSRVAIFNHADKLPLVGSATHFKKLLAKQYADRQTQNNRLRSGTMLFADSGGSGGAVGGTAGTGATQPTAPPALDSNKGTSGGNESSGGSSGDNDFSQTNTQVDGVDEADVVKNDREFIYQVRKNVITITKVYPSNQMEVVSHVKFGDDANFNPSEIYVDGNRLVVIGSSHEIIKRDPPVTDPPVIAPPTADLPTVSPAPSAPPVSDMMIGKPYYGYEQYRHMTKAYTFDMQDKANIRPLREFRVEGYYVSSRKIGSQLYLIANKSFYYNPFDEKAEIKAPSYYDSAVSREWLPIDFSEIRYFTDSNTQQFLMIAGIDVNQTDTAAALTTFLGNGEKVYASKDNLYVTMTKYQFEEVAADTSSSVTGGVAIAPSFRGFWWRPASVSTTIYKFGLNQGVVNFVAKGSAPGTVLNQFSMDEHNDHFRVATTKTDFSDPSFGWQGKQTNHLYVLDNQLRVKGFIDDIAPGERIYSARFMGDRGYMVTFKTVDPLFVLDLADPANPSILGELKIPGYSTYMHPYDENHIIGIGMDTTEYDWGGGTPVAINLGMKMALFDVSDVNNPIEKFVEKIGDRGTSSELLYNHKALLFSKEKNLFALPVTLYENKNKANPLNYGEFTFQGAYVYSLDPENGFQLRKRISHYNENEISPELPYWWYHSENSRISRILYIKDRLYTVSHGKIQAHDLATLDFSDEVLLK